MVLAFCSSSFFGGFGASGALLLSLLCVTPRAHAQELEAQPMQAGRGMVLTHVNAGPHSFAVFFGRGAHPIADCQNECDFWAWPGKYRVLVRKGEGPHDDANVALRIHRPGSYAFVPAQGSAQNAGLILGVAGPAVAGLGLVSLGWAALHTCNDPHADDSCKAPTLAYLGLSALAVGGVMTAVGWPLYVHNRAHFDESDAAPPRPLARWGVMPMAHGGIGLGATFAF